MAHVVFSVSRVTRDGKLPDFENMHLVPTIQAVGMAVVCKFIADAPDKAQAVLKSREVADLIRSTTAGLQVKPVVEARPLDATLYNEEDSDDDEDEEEEAGVLLPLCSDAAEDLPTTETPTPPPQPVDVVGSVLVQQVESFRPKKLPAQSPPVAPTAGRLAGTKHARQESADDAVDIGHRVKRKVTFDDSKSVVVAPAKTPKEIREVKKQEKTFRRDLSRSLVSMLNSESKLDAELRAAESQVARIPAQIEDIRSKLRKESDLKGPAAKMLFNQKFKLEALLRTAKAAIVRIQKQIECVGVQTDRLRQDLERYPALPRCKTC